MLSTRVLKNGLWSYDLLRTVSKRKIAITGQSLPIFHSGGGELFKFGEDFSEAVGEPGEASARITV